VATAVEEQTTTVQAEPARFLLARVRAERVSLWVQIAALAGAAACIVGAASLQQPINAQRKELQLVASTDLYRDLPPIYGLVGAAGGPLRAITSMYLWNRAEELKQEGKLFQSLTLAKWICTLQPRFPTIWGNRAWDLSYNISVGTHTRRERWQWVYNGIRLLRDEGIPNNDRFLGLYRELAWIWFHKVGDRLDDYHIFYKRQWAANMEILLGAPPAGVSDEQTIDWFRPVAAAPRTLEALIAEHPGTADLVRQLAGLGIDVNATTNPNRVYHPLEEQFFRPYTAWAEADKLRTLRAGQREVAPEQARLEALLAAASKPDLEALLAYLRAKVLREQYKMDPQFMLDLTGRLMTEKPIPIDWRTPFSQAIYWEIYGMDKCEGFKPTQDFDKINADRIMVFSVEKLREAGRYIFRLNLDSPMDSYLSMAPDFRYLEAMHNIYLELGKRHAEKDEDVTNKTSDMLKTGHVNFLEEAIIDLYLAGKPEEARKWQEYLARTYKNLDTNQTKPEYVGPLDEFVFSRIKDKIDTYNGALGTCQAILLNGYYSLIAGWPDEYAAQVSLAEEIYRRYQADKLEDPNARRTFPPFVQVRASMLISFLLMGDHTIYDRVLAWQKEDDEVKRHAYDYMSPYFGPMAEAAGFDPAKAFPPPPGMDEWRKAHPAPLQPEQLVQQEKERKKAQEQK
jgi:hypothetical protein